VVDCPSVFR